MGIFGSFRDLEFAGSVLLHDETVSATPSSVALGECVSNWMTGTGVTWVGSWLAMDWRDCPTT